MVIPFVNSYFPEFSGFPYKFNSFVFFIFTQARNFWCLSSSIEKKYLFTARCCTCFSINNFKLSIFTQLLSVVRKQQNDTKVSVKLSLSARGWKRAMNGNGKGVLEFNIKSQKEELSSQSIIFVGISFLLLATFSVLSLRCRHAW